MPAAFAFDAFFFFSNERIQQFSKQSNTTQMTIRLIWKLWLAVCYMVKLNEILSLGVDVALANGPA